MCGYVLSTWLYVLGLNFDAVATHLLRIRVDKRRLMWEKDQSSCCMSSIQQRSFFSNLIWKQQRYVHNCVCMLRWYNVLLYELVSKIWISEIVVFILSASAHLENMASV